METKWYGPTLNGVLMVFVFLGGYLLASVERPEGLPEPSAASASGSTVASSKAMEQPAEAGSDGIDVAASAEGSGMRWNAVEDVGTVLGKWSNLVGTPLPEVEIIEGLKGSRTKYNLRVQNEESPVYVGCGFDHADMGTAWCIVQDDHTSRAHRKVETTVVLERNYMGWLRVRIEGVTEVVVIRLE